MKMSIVTAGIAFGTSPIFDVGKAAVSALESCVLERSLVDVGCPVVVSLVVDDSREVVAGALRVALPPVTFWLMLSCVPFGGSDSPE